MRTRFWVLGGMLGILVAGSVEAQPVDRRGARAGDRATLRGPGESGLTRRVESALRQRERLGLTEAQVADLETLRGELQASLRPLREETSAFRSEARSAEADRQTRSEMRRAAAESRRSLMARVDTVTAPFQGRFEQVVSPLQRRDLERSDRRRAGRGGASARGRQGRSATVARGSRARLPAYRERRAGPSRAWRADPRRTGRQGRGGLPLLPT